MELNIEILKKSKLSIIYVVRTNETANGKADLNLSNRVSEGCKLLGVKKLITKSWTM